MGMGDPTCNHPEVKLAELLKGEGIEIEAKKLQKLVVRHWVAIQTLAHRIHDLEMMERGRREVRREFKAMIEGA